MLTGAHVILYAHDAEAARAFLDDTLGLRSVDAGGGWLIFALPPAEVAVHPTDGPVHHELFLMCDDLEAALDDLRAKGVEPAGPVSEEGWGRLAPIPVPGLGEVGLYEPRHPRPQYPA
ncbi:MAG TPA: VOC family protein [Solirubrobacteraceae bacterium]|jgi:catechol 2,3-dioxygenase-like lactoylglutathione lyase family enzyme|nr:VOC family protein [Solirubrobacteraceae bacterium]